MPKPSDAPAGNRYASRRDRRDRSSFAERPGIIAPAAKEGRLVVGLQPVREALRVHGDAVRVVFITKQQEDGDSGRVRALARFARDRGVADVRAVEARELDRAAGSSLHQGVAAIAPPLAFVDPQVLIEDPALLAIALDGIQDPQNFGAVVRSAVAIADAGIVWPEHGSAPLSIAMFRASAGAVEHARLCRVASLPTFLHMATTAGVQVVGLDAQAERTLRDVPLLGPTVLVIGGEHTGMRRSTRRACSHFARLAGSGKIDSLNASVAAAVTLYEAVNQRIISNIYNRIP